MNATSHENGSAPASPATPSHPATARPTRERGGLCTNWEAPRGHRAAMKGAPPARTILLAIFSSPARKFLQRHLRDPPD
jgi:hypothetical protein